jgi:hypothetical protein
VKEYNGVRGEGFAASNGSNFFAGLGFDVDLLGGGVQELCEAAANARFPVGEAWLFRVDGAIEVDDLPVLLAEGVEDSLEECGRIGIEKCGAGVGEPFADIAQCSGTEEGIDDGMEEDIGIAMTIEPERSILNMDSAEHERSAGDCAVGIVTFADAEGEGVHVLLYPAGRGFDVVGRIAKGAE